VFQVSDRRLIDADTGEMFTDSENKVVDYWGQVAFAYTGISTVGNTPTHLWIADSLAGIDSIPLATRAIRERATNDLRLVNTRRKTWKRLAVIGVGWYQESLSSPAIPMLALVTNFHDANGNQLDYPLDKFISKLWLIKNLGHREVYCVSVGQKLDADIAKNLYRNLKKCVTRPDVGPMAYLRLIINAMREVASRNHCVGKELLTVSLPRSALGKNYITMADGTRAMYSVTAKPAKYEKAFLYCAEGDEEGVEYGPDFVYGGTVLSGYMGIKLTKDFDISTRIIRLEEGGKAGLIFLEDGRTGYMIARVHNAGS
jgi:hypothetical protein